MAWSREAIICLIDSYKNHTCLYAVKSPLYHNRHARQCALQAVAESMAPYRNTTLEEVKAKFTNLRTAFLTEKQKVDKFGSIAAPGDAVYVPNLWYYDKMQYIAEHIIPRKSRIISYEEFELLQNKQEPISNDQFSCEDEIEMILPNECTSTPSPDMTAYVPEKCDLDDLPIKRRRLSAGVESNTGMQELLRQEVGSSDDALVEFGNFVVSRLCRIQDPEILLKLEHDIQLRIMEAEREDCASVNIK